MSSPKQFRQGLHEWLEVLMRHSMQALMRFLKTADLSMAQYTALMRVHYGGMCGVGEVGNHLGVTNAAASQLVDRLVQLGLIDRIEDPHDRRAKQLTISDKGRVLIQQSFEARLAWTEDLTHALTPEQRDTILRALHELTEVAQREVPTQPVSKQPHP